jgi:pentatricopeptide repeat protein
MLSVLNTAARHGEPEIAADVLRVLQLADVAWQEYHFSALIEAFCRNGQIKEALITLGMLKSHDISPTSSTTSFILDSIKRDVDTLDATWAIIDEIHEAKNGLDIEALKVVIEASIFLGDLQRAVGIYKSLADYDIQPDLATFNLLLDGCIGAQHRKLGDLLLEDMKDAKIKPDSATFEKLIELCLTQEVYEDAFFYLEEMKAAGIVPPITVYEAILKKCISVEDTRSVLVLQEMRECGYKPQDTRHSTAANAVKVNKQRRNP